MDNLNDKLISISLDGSNFGVFLNATKDWYGLSIFSWEGETYTCTTCFPDIFPVFFIFTSMVISSFLLVNDIFEMSKVVYDNPKPNGYKGLTLALSKYL